MTQINGSGIVGRAALKIGDAGMTILQPAAREEEDVSSRVTKLQTGPLSP